MWTEEWFCVEEEVAPFSMGIASGFFFCALFFTCSYSLRFLWFNVFLWCLFRYDLNTETWTNHSVMLRVISDFPLNKRKICLQNRITIEKGKIGFYVQPDNSRFHRHVTKLQWLGWARRFTSWEGKASRPQRWFIFLSATTSLTFLDCNSVTLLSEGVGGEPWRYLVRWTRSSNSAFKVTLSKKSRKHANMKKEKSKYAKMQKLNKEENYI